VEVVGLLTTLTAEYHRVSMHAVRRELVELQAEAAGLPLWPVEIPTPCSSAEYESIMSKTLEQARNDGVNEIAFGDLFLTDVREYRERMMSGTGIVPRFPHWPRRDRPVDTHRLARKMQAAGLEAFVTCVDPRRIDASFAGRRWDEAFLAALPESADPCGENGEFHTFVVGGPMLRHRVAVTVGDIVARAGFVFADLLAVSEVP
jgi:diphthamide synthase (EF-2-diphthine--ammonia ligase)